MGDGQVIAEVAGQPQPSACRLSWVWADGRCRAVPARAGVGNRHDQARVIHVDAEFDAGADGPMMGADVFLPVREVAPSAVGTRWSPLALLRVRSTRLVIARRHAGPTGLGRCGRAQLRHEKGRVPA